KLVLVTESHLFQREDCLTGLVHRLDVVLESLRGNDRAELAIRIYDHPNPTSHRYSTDARGESCRLRPYRADANCVGLASNTFVADSDIVLAGSVEACTIAQRDIESTGFVVIEGVKTVSRVVAAESVKKEGTRTVGGVIDAGFVGKEGVSTVGRVIDPGRVFKERVR